MVVPYFCRRDAKVKMLDLVEEHRFPDVSLDHRTIAIKYSDGVICPVIGM